MLRSVCLRGRVYIEKHVVKVCPLKDDNRAMYSIRKSEDRSVKDTSHDRANYVVCLVLVYYHF